MKKCARNRKSIAWFAVGALESQQAEDLRKHIETCEVCRAYLAQTENVTSLLSVTELRSDAKAMESFHRRIARAGRQERRRSMWMTVCEWLRGNGSIAR